MTHQTRTLSLSLGLIITLMSHSMDQKTILETQKTPDEVIFFSLDPALTYKETLCSRDKNNRLWSAIAFNQPHNILAWLKAGACPHLAIQTGITFNCPSAVIKGLQFGAKPSLETVQEFMTKIQSNQIKNIFAQYAKTIADNKHNK
jgi:hypothetical protein